jgi:hypothetical protein
VRVIDNVILKLQVCSHGHARSMKFSYFHITDLISLINEHIIKYVITIF